MYSQNDKQGYTNFQHWNKQAPSYMMKNGIPGDGHTIPRGHPLDGAIPLNDFDSLPNQRNRFLSESRNPARGYMPGYTSDGSQESMAYLANGAGMHYLYDPAHPSVREGKVPFIGSYFDQHTLRNEFEQFILLKLGRQAAQSGANHSAPQTPLSSHAASVTAARDQQTERSGESASRRQSELKHAQKERSENAAARPAATNGRGNAGARAEMESAAQDNSPASPGQADGQLEKKQFFDKFDDERKNKWNENDPRMDAAVDRKTFGGRGRGRRVSRGQEQNARRGFAQGPRRGDDRQRGRGMVRGRGRGFGRGGQRNDFRNHQGRGERNEGENYFREQKAAEQAPVQVSESEDSGEDAADDAEENTWGKPAAAAKSGGVSFGDGGDEGASFEDDVNDDTDKKEEEGSVDFGE